MTGTTTCMPCWLAVRPPLASDTPHGCPGAVIACKESQRANGCCYQKSNGDKQSQGLAYPRALPRGFMGILQPVFQQFAHRFKYLRKRLLPTLFGIQPLMRAGKIPDTLSRLNIIQFHGHYGLFEVSRNIQFVADLPGAIDVFAE